MHHPMHYLHFQPYSRCTSIRFKISCYFEWIFKLCPFLQLIFCSNLWDWDVIQRGDVLTHFAPSVDYEHVKWSVQGVGACLGLMFRHQLVLMLWQGQCNLHGSLWNQGITTSHPMLSSNDVLCHYKLVTWMLGGISIKQIHVRTRLSPKVWPNTINTHQG